MIFTELSSVDLLLVSVTKLVTELTQEVQALLVKVVQSSPKKYKVSAAASSIVPLSFASQVAERWPTNSNRPPGTPAARQQVATAMVHSNGTKRYFFLLT